MGNRPRIYDPFRAGSFAGAKEGGISMIVKWLYWSARGGLLVVMLCGKGLVEEGIGFSISFDDSSGFLAIDPLPDCAGSRHSIRVRKCNDYFDDW